MTTCNLINVRFTVGPLRCAITGPAEDHFEFTPPDYPQASAEEFAAAAASAIPFSYEAAGSRFTGTAILADDGRIVVVSKSGERGVAKLTPDAAARLRGSLEVQARQAQEDMEIENGQSPVMSWLRGK